MKRCPQCKKDYLDDSLMYCLDDGASLVQGTVVDEPATAILSGDAISGENLTETLPPPDSITAQASRRSSKLFGSTHEFDVTRDGQKFVIGTLIGEPTAPPPPVILNWTGLLKK